MQDRTFVTHSVLFRGVLVLGATIVAALGVGCGHFGSVVAPPQTTGALGASRIGHANPIGVHVHTWLYADHAQPAPDWNAVAQYLDYAMVGQSVSDRTLAASISAAGIGLVEYTNPNRQVQFGPPHFPNNLPTDYAWDCKGYRIYKVGYGSFTPPPGPTPTPTDRALYLMDPHSSNLATSWATEVTTFRAQSGVTPAFVFEDSTDSLDGMSARPPCHFGQPDWTNATNSLDLAMLSIVGATGESVALIYNGLASPKHPSPTHTPSAFGVNAVAAGGMAENCYSRQSAPTALNPDPEPAPEHDSEWLVTENVEIAMAAASKMFVCNANSDQSPDAAGQTGLRTYVIASFLLSYDPNTSVLDEQFRTPAGFSVFPESEIVALNPLAGPPAQISDLAVAGVYARQYGSCFVKGTSIGPCVAVVNPSSTTAYPFPFAGSYAGSLKLVGAGLLDAGARIRLLPTVPAALGPRTAVVAYGAPSPSPIPSPSPTP